MYVYFFSLFLQCKGISKFTYYNFFFYRVLYVVYVSVESYVLCIRLKCSVLFFM